MFATFLMMSMTAAPPEAVAPTNLDGAWTVICFEKNGQAVAEAKRKTITVKDGTFTCRGKDGKPGMTFKVDFTKERGQFTMTEIQNDEGKPTDKADAKAGVYVLTNDFLAICVHDTTSPIVTEKHGPSGKNVCSIILKREGSGR